MFAKTASTLGLFDFSLRTLEDFSGNGFDLEGTHKFREVAPQVWELAPGSDVFRPVRDALLALTGEMTVEVTGTMYAAPGLLTLVGFFATGETLATNVQWLLGTQDAHRLRWLQEHGSTGTDAPTAPLAALNANESLPAPGCDFIATGVRHSDGSVALYINGRLHAQSGPITAPAGGTSSVLRVMSGATAFGLRGIRISGVAMTPTEVSDSAATVLGTTPLTLGRLWVGAVTDTSATVVARMAGPVADVFGTPGSPIATDADNVARITLTGLDPDTAYDIELPCGVKGGFRTLPPANAPASFTIAFSGDNDASSNHRVFQAIVEKNPLMFWHLGDMGYPNPTTANPALFHANYDTCQASPGQHRLLRSRGIVYIPDDHESGPNDCDGTNITIPTACAVYRSRVPSYPLPDALGRWHTFDIGSRVRVIVTDQRAHASPNAMVDGPLKSMLGAAQKAWFKGIVANSPGMLLVWICPRWLANANHSDSWNNFAFERTELFDWCKIHSPGRVVGLEADKHSLGIDDGTNVDYATGGGGPIPWFRASPLDRPGTALSGTYSHGEFNSVGQFGLFRVDDDGTDIIVTWTGHDSTGAALVTHTLTVTP